MTSRTKMLILILIFLTALTGLTVYCLSTNTLNPLSVVLYKTGNEGALPKPTGKVDDIVNAMHQEVTEEQTALGDAKDEKALIMSDSQDVGGFSQSVNENGF